MDKAAKNVKPASTASTVSSKISVKPNVSTDEKAAKKVVYLYGVREGLGLGVSFMKIQQKAAAEAALSSSKKEAEEKPKSKL